MVAQVKISAQVKMYLTAAVPLVGGPAFNVDKHAFDEANIGKPSQVNYCNVKLDPMGDFDRDHRRVFASYVHNYRDVSINGVSVSYPTGVSVTVGNSSKQRVFDTDDNGDLLIVRQSDV